MQVGYIAVRFLLGSLFWQKRSWPPPPEDQQKTGREGDHHPSPLAVAGGFSLQSLQERSCYDAQGVATRNGVRQLRFLQHCVGFGGMTALSSGGLFFCIWLALLAAFDFFFFQSADKNKFGHLSLSPQLWEKKKQTHKCSPPRIEIMLIRLVGMN